MNSAELWTIIFALGIGSYALRFSFLGIVGNRPMPAWLLRHLRYTAVALLPALVAPLVVWPNGPGEPLDPGQMIAALCTLFVGAFFKSSLLAIFTGIAVLAAIIVLT